MIAIYCPDVPPVPGGVADQTLELARALSARGHPPVVLARRGDAALFAPVRCVTGVVPGAAAETARAHGARTMLVQYVPFLYAASGVAPELATLPSRARRADVRLAVFVHEPFVPFTRLPWLVTGPLQRLQLRTLLRGADRVYAAVPGFVAIAQRYARAGTPVALAPVGAGIPPSPLDTGAARRHLGIPHDRVVIGVFSPAASGFRRDWIAAAAARLAGRGDILWLFAGAGSDAVAPGEPTGPFVRRLGRLSASDAATAVRTFDLALAPYVDGLTLRRTGAMLALASGVATISSTGHLFDPSLEALAVCEPDVVRFAGCVSTLADSPAARRSLAERTAGYHAMASVDVLARRLIDDLEPAGAPAGAA